MKLNLINEEGYFYLDQCREIRNNFSAAHPSIGVLDDREFIVFLSRNAKYALSSIVNPRGVDINELIKALKLGRFEQMQLDTWIELINKTHDAQRQIIVSMLHGIYCDPNYTEPARLNSIDICLLLKEQFTPSIKSELINRHNDYITQSKNDRHKASGLFFEKLGLVSLLSDSEKHTILSRACKHLLLVHNGWDNFYNEPPFAERLSQLSIQGEIPDTTKEEYVTVVLTCYIGNRYGVSIAAIPFLKEMIQNFKPKEIMYLVKLPETNTIVANRIKTYSHCKKRYIDALKLLDPKSISSTAQKNYDSWIKE